MAPPRLLAVATFAPDETKTTSDHELLFTRPVHLTALRVVPANYKPHPREMPAFAGATPPTRLQIELFAAERGVDTVARPMLSRPHLHAPDQYAAELIPVPESAARHRSDYVVVRADSVTVSLCFYGVEAAPSQPPVTPPAWRTLPSFWHMDGALASLTPEQATPRPEDAAAVASDERRPVQLLKLATRGTSSPATYPGAPRALRLDEVGAPQPHEIASKSLAAAAAAACEDAAAKPAAAHEVREAAAALEGLDDRAVGEALDSLANLLPTALAHSGCVEAATWTSMAETLLRLLKDYTLRGASAPVAHLERALHAIELVCVQQDAAHALVSGGCVEALVVCAAERLFASGLRRRALVSLLVLLVAPGAMDRFTARRAGNQSSGYERVVALLQKPVPLNLLQHLREVCSLVSVWRSAIRLRSLVEGSSAAEGGVESSGVATTAVSPDECSAALERLVDALQRCTEPAPTVWQLPGEAATPWCKPIGLGVTLMLSRDAKVWQSLAALISASVPGSPTPYQCTGVEQALELLLGSSAGAIALAADEGLTAAPLCDLVAAGARSSGHDNLTTVDRVGVKLFSHIRCVRAFERLLAGQLGALHTLVSLDALGRIEVEEEAAVVETSCDELFVDDARECAEAVALLFGTREGLGVLSALMLYRADGGVAARCAAALLLSALTGRNGARILREHALWLRSLVEDASSVAASEADGAALRDSLADLESVLQPAILLRFDGPLALSLSCASAAAGRAAPWLASFRKAYDAGEASADAASEAAAPQSRRLLALRTPMLRASLSLLRDAAADAVVATELVESDATAFLTRLMSATSTALSMSCSDEGVLFRVIEHTADIIYALLWYSSSTGGVTSCNRVLLRALCAAMFALARQSSYGRVRRAQALVHPTLATCKSASRAPVLVAADAVRRCLSAIVENGGSGALEALVDCVTEARADETMAALVLAEIMPPPCPLVAEQMADAALPVPPPAMVFRLPSSFHSSDAIAVAAAAGKDATLAVEDTKMDTDGGTGNGTSAALHNSRAGADESSLRAILDRRYASWQAALEPLSVRLFEVVCKVSSKPSRLAILGGAALASRLVELLPRDVALAQVVSPLLETVATRSKRLSGALNEAAGEDGASNADVARELACAILILVGTSAHASGRRTLLDVNEGDQGRNPLSYALIPALQAANRQPDFMLPILSLVDCICEHGAANGEASLPGLAIMQPAVELLLSHVDSPYAERAAAARALGQRLLRLLATSEELAPLVGSLREKLSPDASAAAAPLEEQQQGPCPFLEDLADEVSSLHRPELVPIEMEHGREGLLQLAHSMATEVRVTAVSRKVSRGGHGAGSQEQPSVRPAKAPRGDELRSKHADDGSGRRPLNSTRALSRHVDDYQAAPVVRKTVDTSPVSVAQPGDGAGSPSAADAMMGGRMPQHPCGGMAVGGEGPMANFGVFGGMGGCTPMGCCGMMDGAAMGGCGPMGGFGSMGYGGAMGMPFGGGAGMMGAMAGCMPMCGAGGACAAGPCGGAGGAMGCAGVADAAGGAASSSVCGGAGQMLTGGEASAHEAQTSAVPDASSSEAAGAGAAPISKEFLMELVQDEEKLQAYLAENPAMMEELMKLA